MNAELYGILGIYIITLLLAWPLGRYIAGVYDTKPHFSDRIFGAAENLFYHLCGIDPAHEMSWKEHIKALLLINLLWFFLAMIILMNQSRLPLNPDSIPDMSPHLAFNTAVSFLVNCNLQHYSGETGLSYFSQVFCVMFLQFVTAASGMAAAALVFRAIREKTAQTFGNFYVFFLRSCVRVLLPVAFTGAVLLTFCGTPMTFAGKESLRTLEGDTMQVARGPVAAMVAIKQAGTNGGGFFGTNSAHPFENPDYFTNMLENVLILLIPVAMVFALGFYLKRMRLAWTIFGVMTLGFLLLLGPALYHEMQGNPALDALGIPQNRGNTEGKETRIGTAASAFWSISTTVTSNGSVNSMHDSYMPLSGAMQMLGMMINSLYGGVGVGLLNFYIFIILAVFISGLMVGRTPEFMGKKIEAREMKIAMITALLHPLLILGGTAMSAFLLHRNPDLGWLNNAGFHGFSEMLYEYTSSAANNGSGFEGLADNTPWWNISTGVVLLLSRYLPIIGPLAIAGSLAAKKSIPESAGTLRTDTPTFSLMIFAVIFIVAALSFFPALTLGPLAEYFSFPK